MKKKVLYQLIIPLLCLCLLVLLFFSAEDREGKTWEPVQITVLHRYSESADWQQVRQGMERASLDYNAELRLLSPEDPRDALQQAKMLQHEVASGTQAVILIPVDRELLSPAVREVSAAMPVVTLETDMAEQGARCTLALDVPAVAQGLCDLVQNGVMPGETVLVLDGGQPSGGLRDRLEMLTSMLEDLGYHVTLAAASAEETLGQAVRRCLSRRSFGAVVAVEPQTLELAAALSHEIPDFPLLYGVGGTTAIAAALEQGDITAILAHNAFTQGYLAVREAAVRVEKRRRTANISLNLFVVRQETMYTPEHQKLLFPVQN